MKFSVYPVFLLSLVMTGNSAAISIKEDSVHMELYENRSCEELYKEISELEFQSLNFESSLYNSRNNGIATVASTVFTPAVFFVGFSNAMTFKSEIESEKTSIRLNYLRNRMGEMRCFSQ